MTDHPSGDTRQYPIYRLARENLYSEVIDRVLSNPGGINAQDPRTKMTALHWACANSNSRLARFLLDNFLSKADPWIKDKWGRLPIEIANKRGNRFLIQRLYERMFPDEFPKRGPIVVDVGTGDEKLRKGRKSDKKKGA